MQMFGIRPWYFKQAAGAFRAVKICMPQAKINDILGGRELLA